jgi:hypothetical protein
MTRLGAAGLALGLVMIWAAFAMAGLAKGGLYLGKHEGDAMHLAEMVLRQAAGEWPHLDYMTPIGVLATAPVAAFVAAGAGIGAAFLAAQAAVAAAMLPALWWIAVSRLGRAWGLVFAVLVIGLVTALVYGEAQRSVSISMHYNRWAWALAFLALAVALLPPRRPAPAADGAILGLAFAALALIKVTYVVAFLPGVLLALALRRDWAAAGVATVAGLAVLGVVTLAAGPAFWAAYVGDLLAVTGSEVRERPGDSFAGIVASPAYLGASLAALAGVALLRQAGQRSAGLVLLTLVPGFFFVTFQNFGNDPQWLYLLAIVLVALRPAAGVRNGLGWDLRQALGMVGLAAAMLALPSAINVVSSPFRHLATDGSDYVALFSRDPRHGDIRVSTEEAETFVGMMPLDAAATEGALRLAGEALPDCQLRTGTIPLMDGIAREVERAGYAGAPILMTDLFSSLWLFGDFPRLPGAAPWYYGGLPGGAAAEFLLVPTCAVFPEARDLALQAARAEGLVLTEVARGDLWRLMAIQRPQRAAAAR